MTKTEFFKEYGHLLVNVFDEQYNDDDEAYFYEVDNDEFVSEMINFRNYFNTMNYLVLHKTN